MPEEINRRLTDHVSQLLFCPTPTAVANLRAEGITRGVHRVGDVMMDAVRQNSIFTNVAMTDGIVRTIVQRSFVGQGAIWDFGHNPAVILHA